MKSSLFALAALLSVVATTPALALSEDHNSAYADSSGGSKFSDPDDALGGDNGNANPLGTVQLGNSGSASFGLSAGNGSSYSGQTPPGYYGVYDPTRQR
jgi:hypothetical protein